MPARKPKPPEPSNPVPMLQAVVAGDPQAWRDFVEIYANFLYALAWRYARKDADTAGELFVAALEGLRRPGSEGQSCYRLRRYLESLERYGARSRFVTWLASVTKNLFRDWYREQSGRRVLPREIEALGPREIATFKFLFWEGLSETEAFQQLHNRHLDLTPERFEFHLQTLYRCLHENSLWSTYGDLLRRSSLAPFSTHALRGEDGSLGWAHDPDQPLPDDLVQQASDRAMAEHVGRNLAQGIRLLPALTRTVLMALVLRNLSGQQVQRLMGFRQRQRVYDEVAKAKRMLRSHLKKVGIEAEQAQRAIGFLDGWLKESVAGEKKGVQISDPLPS